MRQIFKSNLGRSWLCCALMVTAFLDFSCENDKNSLLQHTADDPVRSVAADGLDWAASQDPLADFILVNAIRLGSKDNPAVIAPKSHLSTQYMQFWLDTIDSYLRNKYPSKLQGIPKPVALVWATKTANSFASPLSNCVEVPIQIQEELAEFSDVGVSINFSGVVFPVRDSKCITSQKVAPNAVVAWFKRNNGACDLAEDGTKVLIGNNCKISPVLISQQIKGARRFQIIATSPVITMTTGMIGLLKSEDQFIAVIAHELVHYYRSHPAMDTKKYNFFYETTESSPANTPKRTESQYLSELGERVIKMQRGNRSSSDLTQIMSETVDNHLGYYTFEQEADDTALEWLAAVGVNPQVMVQKLLALLAARSLTNPVGEFEYNYAQCLEAYSRHWRDESGNYDYVPIGNFADPHHSLCYRIFNVSREILAHKYTISSLHPLYEGKSWTEIQRAASEFE